MLNFGITAYKDFIFAQSNFLRLVGGPIEFFRLIIIYYIFKYSFSIKNNFARFPSARKQKCRGLPPRDGALDDPPRLRGGCRGNNGPFLSGNEY